MDVDGFSPECDCSPRVGGACIPHALEQYEAEVERLRAAHGRRSDELREVLAKLEQLRHDQHNALEFVQDLHRRGHLGEESAGVLRGYLLGGAS